jgi:hypothetical protein
MLFYELYLFFAVCSLAYPVFTILFCLLNLRVLYRARERHPTLARQWAIRYFILFGIFVATALALPVSERHWSASISGMGSGTLSVAEVRFERLNLTNALFQPAVLALLGALNPDRKWRVRGTLLVVGLVLLACALWALTNQMPTQDP